MPYENNSKRNPYRPHGSNKSIHDAIQVVNVPRNLEYLSTNQLMNELDRRFSNGFLVVGRYDEKVNGVDDPVTMVDTSAIGMDDVHELLMDAAKQYRHDTSDSSGENNDDKS